MSALSSLRRARSKGFRPAGEVWVYLGTEPELTDDLRIDEPLPVLDLVPLQGLDVVLAHPGWTPAEVWAVGSRVVEVGPHSMVVHDLVSERTALLLHPELGLGCWSPWDISTAWRGRWS